MQKNDLKKLGVNIDHVATVRQARGGFQPDPVQAAVLVELAGADGITIHLREDRRHITDRDLRILRRTLNLPLNLEMSITEEIRELALNVGPDQVTLVPERREELTTEGGLNILENSRAVQDTIAALRHRIPILSLFVDAEEDQIRASVDCGAHAIEIHTGPYCEAVDGRAREKELKRIREAAAFAASLELNVFAGHGLNYQNVRQIASIPEISELNIGHSIIGRALFVGLERAVRDMLMIIRSV